MASIFSGAEAHMWSLVNGGGGASIKSVQSGITTLGNSISFVDISLMAVNLSRAYANVFIMGGSGADTFGELCVSGRFTSATNLRLSRKATTGSNCNVGWQVTEFLSGVSVQQVVATLANVAFVDVAIASVNPAKTMLQCSWESPVAGTVVAYGQMSPYPSITTPTNLHIERRDGSASATEAVVFVVEVK